MCALLYRVLCVLETFSHLTHYYGIVADKSNLRKQEFICAYSLRRNIVCCDRKGHTSPSVRSHGIASQESERGRTGNESNVHNFKAPFPSPLPISSSKFLPSKCSTTSQTIAKNQMFKHMSLCGTLHIQSMIHAFFSPN